MWIFLLFHYIDFLLPQISHMLLLIHHPPNSTFIHNEKIPKTSMIGSILFLINFVVYRCFVCMCVCTPYAYSAPGGKKRALNYL